VEQWRKNDAARNHAVEERKKKKPPHRERTVHRHVARSKHTRTRENMKDNSCIKISKASQHRPVTGEAAHARRSNTVRRATTCSILTRDSDNHLRSDPRSHARNTGKNHRKQRITRTNKLTLKVGRAKTTR